MITWKEVTESRYDEMLGILPPALWVGHGFLVGEPWRHNDRDEPMFAPFLHFRDRFWEGSEPMTIPEFRAFNPPTNKVTP